MSALDLFDQLVAIATPDAPPLELPSDAERWEVGR